MYQMSAMQQSCSEATSTPKSSHLHTPLPDQLGYNGPLLASSQGNNYILVVTDIFSKWVDAFPLAKTDSDSDTLTSVLIKDIICIYGESYFS